MNSALLGGPHQPVTLATYSGDARMRLVQVSLKGPEASSVPSNMAGRVAGIGNITSKSLFHRNPSNLIRDPDGIGQGATGLANLVEARAKRPDLKGNERWIKLFIAKKKVKVHITNGIRVANPLVPLAHHVAHLDGHPSGPRPLLTQTLERLPHAQAQRHKRRCDCPYCGPGIPVHHACFAQPPAPAYAVEHRHRIPSLLEPILP